MSLALNARETVVLLHGLARTDHAMAKIECALENNGYAVLNMRYPSRCYPIEQLSKMVRDKVISDAEGATCIHFVTHSMGGILVRYIQQHFPINNIGRVVMLSPPNQGSEVVDKLGGYKLFAWINGLAGLQLGTSADGLVAHQDSVDFELGVITGDRSINWILSCMIVGRDDGKVSVERAKVDGMQDYLVLHTTHPFIMRNQKAIKHILLFLKNGRFAEPQSSIR